VQSGSAITALIQDNGIGALSGKRWRSKRCGLSEWKGIETDSLTRRCARLALRAGETAKRLALQFQAYHKSHADLLHFAASLEQAAVNAYLGAVSQFSDKALY